MPPALSSRELAARGMSAAISSEPVESAASSGHSPAVDAPAPSVARPGLSPPASEVRSLTNDPEHTTLHSASHPGSGSTAQWDERRVVHLEHELDQLSARQRLLDKRFDDLVLRLRTVLVVFLLTGLAFAAWVVTRLSQP